MATDDRRTLLGLLAKYAYAYKPGGFTLVSGKVSDEYLDCKMALCRGEALPPLGRVFLAALDPRVVAVGGLTMGADPIATSIAHASAAPGSSRPLSWFSVRKDAKEHGKKKTIEGAAVAGSQIAVLDDVCTTGGSTIQAIEKCREGGLAIVQVLVLVDREEESGMGRIEQAAGAGVPVVAMFKKSEVRREWEAQQR
jgi:orotate phosphoribosyltransferase